MYSATWYHVSILGRDALLVVVVGHCGWWGALWLEGGIVVRILRQRLDREREDAPT